jgi:hypothetical protein
MKYSISDNNCEHFVRWCRCGPDTWREDFKFLE